MVGANYNASSSPIFRELNVYRIRDMYEFEVMSFMYNFVHKSLPLPLLRIFDYHGDFHYHATRHSIDPKPPNFNSDLMRRSFLYKGPCLWLALDYNVKSSSSVAVFKKKIMYNIYN